MFIKKTRSLLNRGACALLAAIACSPFSSFAELSNLEMNGDKQEVKKGDILLLVKTQFLTYAGLISIVVCIIGVLMTVWEIIKGWHRYSKKEEDSLFEALGKPVLIGVFVTSVSFAIAVYLKDYSADWLGL
jgi:hypothetical protein